jgi:hypothetical protein
VDPDTLVGVVLSVTRTVHAAHGSPDDYPAAARWDWDSVNQVQYVGVKCGAGWCEIGPNGTRLSDLPPSATLSPSAALASGGKERHIKGWFDQQQLAPPVGSNPTSPLPGWGTVFPAAELGSYVKSRFEATWLLTALVALDSSLEGYGEKLNLHPARADQEMNRVYLCKGAFAECLAAAATVPEIARALPPESAPPKCPTVAADVDGVLAEDAGVWWAAIVPPDGAAAFRCVIRRDHGGAFQKLGMAFPGFVRWRWRNNDETIWIRCDQGCCEVEGPG